MLHKNDFEVLYERLCDDTSRMVMDAYLNAKISGDKKYIDSVWTELQYFVEGITDLASVRSFVDCGAFDGDTYISFCENYKKQTGKNYNGEAYLFEPSSKNAELIVKRAFGENVKIVQKGAWDQPAFFSFANTSDSVGSKIIHGTIISDQSSIETIEVDAIDNIVKDRVDFIKMDIQGAELSALKGAAKSIATYHPILAICVYHRKDDLIAIPNFIYSLYSKYKFYLRLHAPRAEELVLYAVP